MIGEIRVEKRVSGQVELLSLARVAKKSVVKRGEKKKRRRRKKKKIIVVVVCCCVGMTRMCSSMMKMRKGE